MTHRSGRTNAAEIVVGLLFLLLSLVFAVGVFAFSAFLFQYNLWCILGLDAPWYGDVLGGFLPFNLPVAILCCVLNLCGVHTPYFHVN